MDGLTEGACWYVGVCVAALIFIGPAAAGILAVLGLIAFVIFHAD